MPSWTKKQPCKNGLTAPSKSTVMREEEDFIKEVDIESEDGLLDSGSENLFDPGQAGDDASDPQEEEEKAPEPDVTPTGPPLPYKKDKFYDGYSRVPTFMDQYERFPNTVKVGQLQAEVFDLMSSSDLSRYNELLSQYTSSESPQVRIEGSDTLKQDGHWKILVHFRYLWYKSLLQDN